MALKPHSVAIGQRYEDNSGWRLLVEVETIPAPGAWVTISGDRFNIGIDEIPWLIDALTTALALVEGDKE